MTLLISTCVVLVLAGVGVLVTLATATTDVGPWRSVGWLLVVAGILCGLAAFWISPLRVAFSQRVSRTRTARLPGDCLSWVKAPGSPASIAASSYLTEGRQGREIVIPGAVTVPTRVHFLKPRTATVRRADLPAEIPAKRSNMRLTHFVPGGFVIDERLAIGDNIHVEIYFD